MLSILIRKNTEKLKEFLIERKINPQIDKKYLLRASVEEYLDA